MDVVPMGRDQSMRRPGAESNPGSGSRDDCHRSFSCAAMATLRASSEGRSLTRPAYPVETRALALVRREDSPGQDRREGEEVLDDGGRGRVREPSVR